jgi:hypothetical protein
LGAVGQAAGAVATPPQLERVADLCGMAERFAFGELLAVLRRDLRTDEDDDVEKELARRRPPVMG